MRFSPRTPSTSTANWSEMASRNWAPTSACARATFMWSRTHSSLMTVGSGTRRVFLAGLIDQRSGGRLDLGLRHLGLLAEGRNRLGRKRRFPDDLGERAGERVHLVRDRLFRLGDADGGLV